MEINSHKLKFRGTVELPKPVEQAHEYHISIVGEVNKVSVDNNHDGTADQTFTMDIASLELLDDNGAIVKAKDRRSMSKKLRGCIYLYQQDMKVEGDEDKYYEKMMALIIKYHDRIFPYLEKLENEPKM